MRIFGAARWRCSPSRRESLRLRRSGPRPPAPTTATGGQRWPDASVLALGLHSVTDYAAWALYQQGECRRLRASADGEGIRDIGDPLLEELPLCERAVERDGGFFWQEGYEGERYELDEPAMGEEFVFEVTRRALGCRLDRYEAQNLALDEYVRKRRGLLGWLPGR